MYSPSFPLESIITSGSIAASWSANGNPNSTTYVLAVFDVNDILVAQNAWTTNLQDTISNLDPSTTYKVKVMAKNAINVTTAWLNIGTTETMPAVKAGLVAAGYWHSVVVKNDGSAAWSCGANASGQLGDRSCFYYNSG